MLSRCVVVVGAAGALGFVLLGVASSPVGGRSAGRVAQGPEGTTQACEEVDGDREITYALKPDNSESAVVMRTAERKDLNLVFSSSCLVREPLPDIEVSLEAGPEDTDDLPNELASQVEVKVRRDELSVVLPIRRSVLHAGRYDANVVLSGEELATVRVPVTVSIKDQRWYLPVIAVLLGLVAGLAAAAFAAVTAGDRTSAIRSGRPGNC